MSFLDEVGGSRNAPSFFLSTSGKHHPHMRIDFSSLSLHNEVPDIVHCKIVSRFALARNGRQYVRISALSAISTS